MPPLSELVLIRHMTRLLQQGLARGGGMWCREMETHTRRYYPESRCNAFNMCVVSKCTPVTPWKELEGGPMSGLALEGGHQLRFLFLVPAPHPHAGEHPQWVRPQALPVGL